MMKTTAVVFASLLLVAGASGCKTTSSAEGGSEKAAPAKAEKSQKNVKQTVPIPASSPLAKIKLGMQRAQVDDLIGEPTSTRVFPSGKAFIPFYYGPDTVRTGAFYKGIGRIVFSGAHQVVEIEYDPTEDGY
jgi:outer membrane protein assembly factor BamE (lipoprotein component of BamABCDE complex)